MNTSSTGHHAPRLVSKEIVGRRIRIDRDQRVGFIAVDNGNDDVFVHRSALAPGGFDTRKEGQELEFDLEPDPQGRGRRAVNVRPATR
jgi:CspA family cold shock protein